MAGFKKAAIDEAVQALQVKLDEFKRIRIQLETDGKPVPKALGELQHKVLYLHGQLKQHIAAIEAHDPSDWTSESDVPVLKAKSAELLFEFKHSMPLWQQLQDEAKLAIVFRPVPVPSLKHSGDRLEQIGEEIKLLIEEFNAEIEKKTNPRDCTDIISEVRALEKEGALLGRKESSVITSLSERLQERLAPIPQASVKASKSSSPFIFMLAAVVSGLQGRVTAFFSAASNWASKLFKPRTPKNYARLTGFFQEKNAGVKESSSQDRGLEALKGFKAAYERFKEKVHSGVGQEVATAADLKELEVFAGALETFRAAVWDSEARGGVGTAKVQLGDEWTVVNLLGAAEPIIENYQKRMKEGEKIPSVLGSLQQVGGNFKELDDTLERLLPSSPTPQS